MDIDWRSEMICDHIKHELKHGALGEVNQRFENNTHRLLIPPHYLFFRKVVGISDVLQKELRFG